MENDEKLTLREYFRLTIVTTKHLLKITGIIFTVICVIILILTEYKNVFTFSDSIVTPLKWFIICILLGNGFGLLLCALAFRNAYKDAKSTHLLFLSIPQEIKEKFGIGMTFGKDDPRYNYLCIIIFSDKPGAPMLFFRRFPQNEVQIVIVNNFNDDINFPKYQLHIDEKYGKQEISLTRWGLSTNIKLKKWETLTPSEIENYINKLIITSENEGLEIIKNK